MRFPCLCGHTFFHEASNTVITCPMCQKSYYQTSESPLLYSPTPAVKKAEDGRDYLCLSPVDTISLMAAILNTEDAVERAVKMYSRVAGIFEGLLKEEEVDG